MRKSGLVLVVLSGLLTALVAACGPSVPPEHSYVGAIIDPPKIVNDFTLTDQSGAEFRLSERVDKLALIYFGYTYCPDICPMSLADMLNVKRRLGDDADSLLYVMVTVDPERDTLAALASRLSVFDPTFVGLTGDRPVLQQVWDDFGVYAEREETVGSATGYLVSHTSSLYLVDEEMHLRLVSPFGTAPEDMVPDIQEILRQQEGVS